MDGECMWHWMHTVHCRLHYIYLGNDGILLLRFPTILYFINTTIIEKYCGVLVVCRWDVLYNFSWIPCTLRHIELQNWMAALVVSLRDVAVNDRWGTSKSFRQFPIVFVTKPNIRINSFPWISAEQKESKWEWTK